MKFVQLTIDGTEVVKFGTWWYNLVLKRHMAAILELDLTNHHIVEIVVDIGTNWQ